MAGVLSLGCKCIVPDARAAAPPIQLRLSSLRSLRLRILPPQGGKGSIARREHDLASPEGGSLADVVAGSSFGFLCARHVPERAGGVDAAAGACRLRRRGFELDGV